MNWTEYELISKEELFKQVGDLQQQLDKALEELSYNEGSYSEGYDDGYSDGYAVGRSDQKFIQANQSDGNKGMC